MGWQKYLVLIRQYKNRSIIKDHFIFKDRQYQKHKVEYKKIVFFFNKCDLIKAVTLSHNSKHDLKKNEIWHHKHIAHRVRSQHARSVELEVALTGAAQAQGAFCFLWGREGRERDCEGNTHTVLLLPSAQEDSSTVEDSWADSQRWLEDVQCIHKVHSTFFSFLQNKINIICHHKPFL